MAELAAYIVEFMRRPGPTGMGFSQLSDVGFSCGLGILQYVPLKWKSMKINGKPMENTMEGDMDTGVIEWFIWIDLVFGEGM